MFQMAPISPRIKAIKERRREHDAHHVIINMERTKIYTDYYKSHEMQLPITKRAGALLEWCKNMTIYIEDDAMFVGNLGPGWRTGNPYVEWGTGWMEMCLALPEDEWIKEWDTDDVYCRCSPEDKKIWQEAVEYWRDRGLHTVEVDAQPDGLPGLIGDNCTSFGSRGFDFACSLPQGHYAPNFDKVISKGWGYIRDDAQSRMDAVEGKCVGDLPEKYTFWRAMKMVAEGAIILTKRYAEAVAELAKEATGDRKVELEMMADGLANIAENPARSTWESMQATCIYHLLLHTDAQAHGLTLGRMDQFCGKFVEEELASGKMTQERLQELADALILKLGDYFVMFFAMPNTTSTTPNENYHFEVGGAHFTMGGLTPEGADATNPLSIALCQTYARLYLTIPSSSVRVHKNTPYELWEAAIESSKVAGGMPIIENDDIIIPGLLKKGIAPEDANDYCIIGCVEPAIPGKEWCASGSNGCESFVNFVGILNMAIHNGVNPKSGNTSGLKTGDLRDMKSFDELKEAFVKQIHHYMDWQVSYVGFCELAYGTFLPPVAASATFDGCMESGKHVLQGGCKYNSTGITAAGIGNVADELVAIKKLVFEDKEVTAEQMLEALNNNWVGYEELQRHIENDLPHYGNADPEVDELATWAMQEFCDYVNQCYGPRGSWRPGTFTVTVHLDFGMATMATPDGRFDGQPLAEAISPRQGFDKNGPTAYLTSAAKLPQVDLMNGTQTNIRFTPTAVRGDAGTKKLYELFSTFFDEGGMQVQFNVVGTETLYDAQEHPADHQDLIVRIAGYSVFFVEIPKVLQDDFITRTEHGV